MDLKNKQAVIYFHDGEKVARRNVLILETNERFFIVYSKDIKAKELIPTSRIVRVVLNGE